MKKVSFKLSGLNCVSCAVLIDTVLEELPGVKSAKTNYTSASVVVDYNESMVTTETLVAAIRKEGYDVS